MNINLVDGHLVCDNSALALVKTCPLQARYKLVDKRERATTTAKGRGPGKALHSWMEHYYVSGEVAANRALEEAYADLALAEGDEYLNLARMQQVTQAYLHGCRFEMGPDGRNGVYTHPGWAAGEPWEVLGVEVPFAVRLGEVRIANEVWKGTGDFDPKQVPVTYIGRSDLVVRMKERGEVLCVDHKSARRWTAADVNHWRRDSGLTGYAACIPQWVREGIEHLPASIQEAMKAHEPLRRQLAEAGVGAGINGFVVNAVVIRDVSDLRRCKEPPASFHREVYYQDASTLQEWRTNALRWCESWLGWCASESWPENTNACCHQFGGLCGYFEVCSLPPGKQRAIMLDSDMFRVNDWSPLDRTKDKS